MEEVKEEEEEDEEEEDVAAAACFWGSWGLGTGQRQTSLISLEHKQTNTRTRHSSENTSEL